MNNNEPIFKLVFGEAWEKIPAVIRKRYSIVPYSNDRNTVEGKMDVTYSPVFTLLLPLLRLFGVLVPYQGKDIPVTVHFHGEPESDALCLERIFHFPGKQPYYFRSKIFHDAGQTIIEYMRFGLGIKFRYEYDGQDIVYLRYAGYVWKIGKYKIPVPIGLLLGKGFGEEVALTDHSFRMRAGTKHMLFGTTFEYKGMFEVR